ncbi:MAG: MFS transporter [bacterium]|nr:MFS transporter [bacterium]
MIYSLQKYLRRSVYLVTFIYTTNFALTLYINSSYLGHYIDKQHVSILFSLASLLAMILLAGTTRLFALIGQHRATQLFLLLNLLGAAALALSTNTYLIIPMWMLFYGTGVLLRFDLDIYMEKLSTNEETGTSRGVFLTILNLAIFISPYIASKILGDGESFMLIYFTAAGMATITLLLVSTTLRGIREVTYRTDPFFKSLKVMRLNANLRNIFVTTFLLEFFYSWMVIYNPLYLHEEIGFGWENIGIILAIMLLPFVLIEYPLGKIADKWLGEKEILTTGLIIMGFSTATIAFISSPNIALFAGLLFLTRIGAAAVEIMNETYFFKHVTAADTGAIAVFRNSRPLAYILGPLVGAVVLVYVPSNFMYLILGAFMLTGVFFSLSIVDTK